MLLTSFSEAIDNLCSLLLLRNKSFWSRSITRTQTPCRLPLCTQLWGLCMKVKIVWKVSLAAYFQQPSHSVLGHVPPLQEVVLYQSQGRVSRALIHVFQRPWSTEHSKCHCPLLPCRCRSQLHHHVISVTTILASNSLYALCSHSGLLVVHLDGPSSPIGKMCPAHFHFTFVM